MQHSQHTVDASDVVPYVLTESCRVCNALSRSSALGACMMVMTTRKAAAAPHRTWFIFMVCCLKQT